MFKAGIKNPLTGGIEIIAVHQEICRRFHGLNTVENSSDDTPYDSFIEFVNFNGRVSWIFRSEIKLFAFLSQTLNSKLTINGRYHNFTNRRGQAFIYN